MQDPVLAATDLLLERYEGIIEAAIGSSLPEMASPEGTDLRHLHWMCSQMRSRMDSVPVDKASRWLGFIQGCLVMHGLISVEMERDFSRPIFHHAYAQSGMETPDTLGPPECQL